MKTVEQLIRLLEENREVAVLFTLAVLVALLVIYLIVRAIFPQRKQVLSGPQKSSAYVPVAEVASHLQTLSQQIPLLLQQLQESLAEKDRLVNEKRQYIELLQGQIAQLQGQIRNSGAEPVLTASEKQHYEQQIQLLQQELRKKAKGNWRSGFFWGAIVTLLIVGAAYVYLTNPDWLRGVLNR
ncbi:MAG: hypothetical protein RMJ44_04980 [Cytophagales bacterium]|nr:hypothetical protein [Bernardetiaceae bacterium]MDW8210419.1 hypothetical protein [Cytophagales bacterium]